MELLKAGGNAPKAGALPGCATPRHLRLFDFKPPAGSSTVEQDCARLRGLALQ